MRILFATDAAAPQVNGVVTTYARLAQELERRGGVVGFLTPDRFNTAPLPGYPEIRLALATRGRVRKHISEFAPDFIHIATEGPIGWAARGVCLADRRPFTTSYHTKIPEYVAAYAGVPERLSYAVLRSFHGAAAGTMVATVSLAKDLSQRSFRNLLPWTRGVDTHLFRPRAERVLDFPRPIFLYVGRIAREKNLEAFLGADLPGTKVVVGDGPLRSQLQARFPAAHFAGPKFGDDLARHYASADVFVFPSLSDTFGLVLLEAMASGAPVAAYPVTGPMDVVQHGVSGILDADLRTAALKALDLDPEAVRRHAMGFSWERAADQFVTNIVGANAAPRAAAGVHAALGQPRAALNS